MSYDHDRDEELRRRAGRVPVRLQRSIDAFRTARGMTPLWAGKASSRPQQRQQQGRPGPRT